MENMKKYWKEKLVKALKEYAGDIGLEGFSVEAKSIVVGTPPKPELGDIAFPLFPFAKSFKTSPVKIAEKIADYLQEEAGKCQINADGPYINIKLDLSDFSKKVIEEIINLEEKYGMGNLLNGKKVMVEFSCPNTNKPLHLGHLRNDSIGASISRILWANGAEVKKVNLINDRGIHICKSMLAYKKFGNGTTPEAEGLKSDHFVGKYYVKYNEWLKEYPGADDEARHMLRQWENGDPEITSLWRKMNDWAIEGIKKTYKDTGIEFDTFYFESETYKSGKDAILKGLEEGVFYSEKDGSIWADLSEIDLDKKVLLRSDGTSLYLTQDIGTAVARHKDWPFDRLIYVVGSEQEYHFKVLFHVLKKLGFGWADNLHHLSYGMVNLPEGKMKSREGTVVDADDLFTELKKMAHEEIKEKGRIEEVGDIEKTTSSIALAALNYYLLQISPGKDMIFDPSDSISFNGNTGPYLQYMGARISSMMRKFEDIKAEFKLNIPDYSLLTEEMERELIKQLGSFPQAVKQAGEELNPSVITAYLYDLSKNFSRYYHDTPILKEVNKELAFARIRLVEVILQVLKNAYFLIGIPFLERM